MQSIANIPVYIKYVTSFLTVRNNTDDKSRKIPRSK